MTKTRGDTQAKILSYIRNSIKERGFPPSVREICDATGLKSTSTVHGHLTRLEQKGLITRNSMMPRAISVSYEDNDDSDTLEVPIMGTVAAGSPTLATENIEGYVHLPKAMLGQGRHFILGVRGDSMIEAGIFHGDYIVVREQHRAYNGEIVVALIDDDTTVKRFYMENGHIRLQPENSSMEPIIVDDCRILGKVVSMYRVF